MKSYDRCFKISDAEEFNQEAIAVFRYQALHCKVYREYLNALAVDISSITDYHSIPFLPISFFKSHQVVSDELPVELKFLSSGTTGQLPSRHLVVSSELYRQSFRASFEQFYGPVSNFCVMGLLPSYLERGSSSLVYMVNDMIQQSGHSESGFYLNNLAELADNVKRLDAQGQPILLIGVTYALLDLIDQFPLQLKHTVVVETGGMKGRREELLKEELHSKLCAGLGVSTIHSEYGMTELLSQAWSKGEGIFQTPPWMKVLIRELYDPFSYRSGTKSGGINVIDLANFYSCSFIETEDLGRAVSRNEFRVLGRFDSSEIRGCNLMLT